MKSGLFAFILLSALVHAIVIGIEDNWTFDINDSHEQGSSSINIELFAKTQMPAETFVAKPASTSGSKPVTTPASHTTLHKEKKPALKTTIVKTTELKVAEPQKLALLSTAKNISAENIKTDEKENKNKEQIQNDNHEKIKALLNNELSKHFYYPKSAQRKNRQGSVLLAFSISPLGKIENIKIKKSSGFSVLDKAAIKALKKINARDDLAKALNGDSMEHTLPVVYKLTRR